MTWWTRRTRDGKFSVLVLEFVDGDKAAKWWLRPEDRSSYLYLRRFSKRGITCPEGILKVSQNKKFVTKQKEKPQKFRSFSDRSESLSTR